MKGVPKGEFGGGRCSIHDIQGGAQNGDVPMVYKKSIMLRKEGSKEGSVIPMQGEGNKEGFISSVVGSGGEVGRKQGVDVCKVIHMSMNCDGISGGCNVAWYFDVHGSVWHIEEKFQLRMYIGIIAMVSILILEERAVEKAGRWT